MFETFLYTLKEVRKRKLRSFLTMLGIIVGVTSVIVLMNVVEGFQKELIDSYESLGILTVEVTTFFKEDSFSTNELEDFKNAHLDIISGYSPAIDASDQEIKYEDQHVTSSIKGIGEDYESIKQLKVENGNFLNYINIKEAQPVCVIGSFIDQTLFPLESSIDKKIKINGNTFIIKGVLEEQEDSSYASSDNLIYVPYTAAQKTLKIGTINNVLFLSKNRDSIEAVVNTLYNYLMNKIKNPERFSIYSLSETIDSMNDLLGKFSMLLIFLALISLVVGGIGIMNIMYVNVVERTQEIGIRIAVGAKAKDILYQFLSEASVLSLLGGIIGIVLGCGLTFFVARLIDIPFIISYQAIGLAIVVSITIGILFGYLPAKKATSLNPIMALNYD